MPGRAERLQDLRVYQRAMDAAMDIFELTKTFPAEEKFSLVDQIRRSSRSVCANIGEAWRRRRYRQSFIARLNDSEAEAAETMVWLEFAVRCGYMRRDRADALVEEYDHITAQLVSMIDHADSWVRTTAKPSE